ncbi:hypothetical protein D3C86_1772610 [compost metagenome]
MQEVDRLAHFGDGVAEGFPGFAYQNANQLLHLAFHQNRGTFKDCSTFLRRRRKPDWRVVHRIFQRHFNFFSGGFAGKPDDIFRLRRVDHRLHVACVYGLLKDRFRLPFLQGAIQQSRREGRQTVFVRQI